LLRRIFPYYTIKSHKPKLCPYCHLKLCPGPNPNIAEYKKDIKRLIAVLTGKNRIVLKNIKKEMQKLSIQENFEKAARIRDKLLALEKITSNAKIFEKQNTPPVDWKSTNKSLQNLLKTKKVFRKIEGYDISNMQGKSATGSMIVFINGMPDKNLYRKFHMKIEGKPNDTAMLKETLQRRFSHTEWQKPDLIFIDGGKPQINAALSIVKTKIPVIALAKRNNELFIQNDKKPVLLKFLPREIFNLILQIRDESHRFAINYHKQLRKKELLG
jgi:excinuclease ABC subunit C